MARKRRRPFTVLWYQELDDGRSVRAVTTDYLIKTKTGDEDFFLNRWRLVTRVLHVEVSTVFLALDHNLLIGRGRPVLYETMTFSTDLQEVEWPDGTKRKYRPEFGNFQQRYHTRAEAVAGHWWTVHALYGAFGLSLLPSTLVRSEA